MLPSGSETDTAPSQCNYPPLNVLDRIPNSAPLFDNYIPHMNPYRTTPEQYHWVSRDFRNGDEVIFIGPPDEEYQPGMIAPPEKHNLYHLRGQIRVGKSESILCYPDEPEADMYWVKFHDDTQPMRQIKGTWIIKVADYDGG